MGGCSTVLDWGLACVGVVVDLDFGAFAFLRGSIVTLSIDTVLCTPSISIVTVDYEAEMTRKGPTDLYSSPGGSFDCLLYGATA